MKKYNKLCLKCENFCKQWDWVTVVRCPLNKKSKEAIHSTSKKENYA